MSRRSSRNRTLTEEEIEAVWESYRDGNDDARKQLHEIYLPLLQIHVNKIAKKLPAHADDSGLMSYAFFGLNKAIERFDPSRGAKFETYASYRIRGMILDYLRSGDNVSRSVRGAYGEIEDFIEFFQSEYGRDPSILEIAQGLDKTEAEISKTLVAQNNGQYAHYDSMNDESDPDASRLYNSAALEDREHYDPFTAFEVSLIEDILVSGLLDLTKKESCVLYWKYGEGVTFVEIADRLGIKTPRASQIHSSAMAKLRESILKNR